MQQPTTLAEAVDALEEVLGDEDKDFLQEATDPEGLALDLHHSLGRHIRNEWGLWQSSPLAQHLRAEHQLDHPDDMSHLIIERYIRTHIFTLWTALVDD